jgi:putative ABC transport system ATP-binding protein
VFGALSSDNSSNGGESGLIVARHLDYTVPVGSQSLKILNDVSLEVSPAEVLAIVGPSGSGKTSLLMLLAGLERPTGGDITLNGQSLSGLSEDGLAELRRQAVGIVFQSFNLVPSVSALDNVSLALEIARPDLKLSECRTLAREALEEVGLGHRLEHRPSALSGGEQQRVGLARAMAARPRLLLADEPTGNLDQETGARVIELMFSLARKHKTAIILITHDPVLAKRADRMLTLSKGTILPPGTGAA